MGQLFIHFLFCSKYQVRLEPAGCLEVLRGKMIISGKENRKNLKSQAHSENIFDLDYCIFDYCENFILKLGEVKDGFLQV